MKIRVGFVSNSSTSSFCIFGFLTKNEYLKEKFLTDDFYGIIETLGFDVQYDEILNRYCVGKKVRQFSNWITEQKFHYNTITLIRKHFPEIDINEIHTISSHDWNDLEL